MIEVSSAATNLNASGSIGEGLPAKAYAPDVISQAEPIPIPTQAR